MRVKTPNINSKKNLPSSQNPKSPQSKMRKVKKMTLTN